MHSAHPKSMFPWWLCVPGVVLAVLAGLGFVRSHPYWTLAIVIGSVIAYVVFLRLWVKAPRGEDPEE